MGKGNLKEMVGRVKEKKSLKINKKHKKKKTHPEKLNDKLPAFK